MDSNKVVISVSVLVILLGLGSMIKAELPRSVTKGLQKCFDKGGINGVVNCAAVRTLNMVNNLSDKENLEVLPGIVLVRDNMNSDITHNVDINNLPENPLNQSEKILELLSNATLNLISQRTLKIKIPKIDSEELSRALNDVEEGRGKKKNKFGGFGGMMGPLMISMAVKLLALIGGVGLLSAKALVVAKLALVVSAIVLVQYYFSNRGGSGYLPPPYFGGGGGGSYYPSATYGTNNLGGWNPQYPYARSLEVGSGTTENYEGEKIAYSAYTQNYQ